MTENITAVSRDEHIVRNAFDFDEYLPLDRDVEDDMEYDYIENEIDGASSSSYEEEEIFVDSTARAQIKLDTVPENEDVEYHDEEVSETEVFWEEVSESVYFESDDVVDEYIIEEPETRSDMIARVRNILKDDTNNHGDGSEVDSSSRCSSSSGEGSSVPPVDFDLGSYEEAELHSPDEEEEEPEDYEKACRVMIAFVYPHLDPVTMLHGCDLQNLYTNLKQQYLHLLRNKPKAIKTDSNNPELLDEERVIIKDDDVNEFTELSINSYSDSDRNFVSPEPIPDDAEFEDANKIPAVGHSNSASEIASHSGSEQVATASTPPVQKWLDRDADDPEDFEYACRRLCHCMYDQNDPDYDVDTMFLRSTPVDLYKYLKHHYWYLVHTNQLDKNALHRNDSNERVEEGEEEKQLDDGVKTVEESTTVNINLSNLNLATDEVRKSRNDEVYYSPSNRTESLRSLFSTRTENSERSKKGEIEKSLENKNKNIEIPKDELFIKYGQPLVTEKIENNEDDDIPSCSDENKTQMQRSEDINELLIVEESRLPSRKGSFDHNETSDNFDDTEESVQDEIIQNSLNNSTTSSFTEKESEEIDMNGPCGNSYSSFREEYSKEYNDMLARHKNGEDIDESRLRGEKLTEDKIQDIEQSFDQEKPLTHEHEGRTEICLSNDSASKVTPIDISEQEMSLSVGDVANSNEKSNVISIVDQSMSFGDITTDFKTGRDDRSEGEHKLIIEEDSSIEKNSSSLSLNDLQDVRSELQIAHNQGHGPKTAVKDPKELEWRNKKIQEDLKSIIKETEEVELHQSISSEIVAALNASSLKTAFTKKFYHPIQHDHIYYPSVAKAVHNFSLVEEAEKVFRNEFSFELSTALRTIASSRMTKDANEVDENDISIREATVTVVLDDRIEAGSNEEAMRSKMI